MTNLRTYSELLECVTFQARYAYLRLSGNVGAITFGFERFLNQDFYRSREWRDIRRHVLIRDNFSDLAFSGHSIHSRHVVHHMNPVSIADFESNIGSILDPEFLITTHPDTHLGIHFGKTEVPEVVPIVRAPNDTIPWRTSPTERRLKQK